MRTLFEIIDAAKIGEPTTHEECLYALLAYSGLSHFDSSALRQLAFEPSKFRTPERQAEESFKRWKAALAKSPKGSDGAATVRQGCPQMKGAECRDLHTPCPVAPGDQLRWYTWAEKMSKTHRQVRCPMCGRFAVWVLRKRRGKPAAADAGREPR